MRTRLYADEIKNAVLRNLAWFQNSGVLLPRDGTWGVAERIATTDNDAIEKMLKSFPAWTDRGDHYVIEQRRADCCFEAAWYFLEAGRLEAKYPRIGGNILDFLYFRSGLLNRCNDQYPLGSWNWSHIKWNPMLFFDDNAWCVFIQIAIARAYPELDRKYDCTAWALRLADSLAVAASRTFDRTGSRPGPWTDPQSIWLGRYDLPHWGSLTAMALASAHAVHPKPEYLAEIRRYHDHIASKADTFIASEQAYALLGCCCCAKVIGAPFYRELALRLGELLMAKIDPATGNLPAEHHESPIGPHLVDTIYTVNWAVMALQALSDLTAAPSVSGHLERLLRLLLGIQDRSDGAAFAGCWRGMFNLNTQAWGGGDCYEGGSGSIYTGWTNTMIGLTLLWQLQGRAITTLL